MPFQLIDNKKITVQEKSLPGDYCMPTLQAASDHYNLGIVTSGDRCTITPNESFKYHAGYVSMIPPFYLHRTVSLSRERYSGYLIKFAPEIATPFIENGGKKIFDELYREKIHRFDPNMTEKIINSFREMYDEYQKDKTYTEQILQGMLFRLLDMIWDNRIAGDIHTFETPLKEPVIQAIALLNQYYSEEIGLEYVAKEVGVSGAYLSRLFKAQLNKSFSEYLLEVRLSNVKQLLIATNKSIMEIANETGFCNGDYLSTCFKKNEGVTPSSFRKYGKNRNVTYE